MASDRRLPRGSLPVPVFLHLVCVKQEILRELARGSGSQDCFLVAEVQAHAESPTEGPLVNAEVALLLADSLNSVISHARLHFR